MARRKKNAGQESDVISLSVPVRGDLSFRLGKISKQTGLSHSDLLQKWILQEEFLIGLLSHGRKQAAPQVSEVEKAASPVVRKTRRKSSVSKAQEETGAAEPESADYRATLVNRVQKLKKEGFTLKKIADTFNEEKVSTISGAGKWYTSSVTWLLRSTK